MPVLTAIADAPKVRDTGYHVDAGSSRVLARAKTADTKQGARRAMCI